MSFCDSWCTTLILLYYFVLNSYVLAQNVVPNTVLAKKGESILNCSDLTNIAEMARCLTRQFAANANHKPTRSGGYGYPYGVAPPLPSLKHEPDHPSFNSIDGSSRRIDNGQHIERRIQGFNIPQYRNFLDLESTLSPRAIEYRPVFQIYDSVPIVPLERIPFFQPDTYDTKPVKTHSRDYARRQKQGKLGPQNAQILYKHTRYNSPEKHDQKKVIIDEKKYYPKTQTYKYNTGYAADSQYSKENGYDTEYYVPANSPIMGDIRRSLMDYAGARDLMEDEPDYLSSIGLRNFRAQEIQPDFYPFRRSDNNVKDLEMYESKQKKTSQKKSA